MFVTGPLATNLIIFLMTVLSMLVAIKTWRRKHRPSAFLILVACIYMIYIRTSVLVLPNFPDTEMVIGFWFLFLSHLYINDKEIEMYDKRPDKK